MTFPIDEAVSRLEKTVAALHTPIVDLIAVQTRDPFKVLVATILSARTCLLYTSPSPRDTR